MMHLHKFLLCLVLACVGQNALGRKIIKRSTGEPPYMASLITREGKHVCSGFLFDKKECDADKCYANVMTSEDCYPKQNKMTRLKICHDRTRSEVEIAEIEKNCTKKNMTIVILKVLWPKDNEHNDCVPKPIDRDFVTKAKNCQVAQWDGKKYKLKQVNCTTGPDKFICGGEDIVSEWNVGGPLVCDDKAVGVISSISNNRTYDYINIKEYETWIKDVIAKESHKDCH